MALRNPRLRAFVKLDANGQVIAGATVLRYFQPPKGFWYEIPQDICCNVTFSNYSLSLIGTTTGTFTLTVGGVTLATETHSVEDTFDTPKSGQTVTATVQTSGPNESLVFINDSQGAVLSNQTGTTGLLTYTWISTGENITIIAFGGPTTTTTTSTTTTSTTTV